MSYRHDASYQHARWKEATGIIYDVSDFLSRLCRPPPRKEDSEFTQRATLVAIHALRGALEEMTHERNFWMMEEMKEMEEAEVKANARAEARGAQAE